MLPHIHRATQKFYIFLIVYLTGCTPKETIFVTLVAAVWMGKKKCNLFWNNLQIRRRIVFDS